MPYENGWRPADAIQQPGLLGIDFPGVIERRRLDACIHGNIYYTLRLAGACCLPQAFKGKVGGAKWMGTYTVAQETYPLGCYVLTVTSPLRASANPIPRARALASIREIVCASRESVSIRTWRGSPKA